ncbi:MAG: hypothetical protein H6843_06905 [Rhodospirillaceae bacterium]|nr:hypothetical protein [Rhodospirillaceae bacterium]
MMPLIVEFVFNSPDAGDHRNGANGVAGHGLEAGERKTLLPHESEIAARPPGSSDGHTGTPDPQRRQRT